MEPLSATSFTNSPRTQVGQSSDFDQRCRVLLDDKERVNQEEACRQLLRDYPRKALAHFLMARMFVETERKGLAFPYAEAAVRLAPDDANFTYYLGFLYMEFSLYEFALPLLRTAVKKFSLNSAKFHEGLGDCYHELGNGEVAIGYYQRALGLTHDSTGLRRCQDKLLQAFVTTGRNQEASKLIEEMIGLGGASMMSALRQKAWIGSEGVNSDTGNKLQELIQDPAVDDKKKVELWLSLGRLHERDKSYDNAFACWSKSRNLAKQAGLKFKNHERVFLDTTTFYSAELLDKIRPYGDATAAPVFIIGMPRSGTTLTEQIVAAHPRAVGVGELARFGKLDRALRNDYPMEKRLERLVENSRNGELLARAAETRRIFEVVAEVLKERIVEKTPHNFECIGYLRLCFPNAKFIHCYRHPLDTFVSSFQNSLNRSHAYAYDQVEYAKEYVHHVRMMDYWKSVLPNQIMTLPYENLATDPETWSRKIIQFIDLPWHDDCLRFFEKAKTVRTISNQQVRNPVYTSSVARWRRYEKHLAPIMLALKDLNYEHPEGDAL